MSTAMLDVQNLTKTFGGVTALDKISLSVEPGQISGLIGPNGAGKTTTFYMLVGLLRPDSGRIELSGAEITMLPLYQRARRGISYLPQEPSVFRKLTVEQNLLAVLETLPPDGGRVELSAEQAQAWLRSLNDVRLALGVVLGITEDYEREFRDLDPGDPRVAYLHVYDFLTFLQETLVRALR